MKQYGNIFRIKRDFLQKKYTETCRTEKWLHYNTFSHSYNNSFVVYIFFALTIKPESDNDMSGTETGIQFDKFAIISLSCSIFKTYY